MNSGVCYDRVFFLSGMDYPLWSNEQIIKELEGNPSKEYIMGMDITTCDEPKKIVEKLALYHFFRDIPFSRRLCGKLSGLSIKIGRTLPFRRKRYIVMRGKAMHVFQGSSWWCVSWACLKYIREGIKNKRIRNYFRFCFAPDELMINTIVFNSPFAENAILYRGKYLGLKYLTPLHHIEYEGAIYVWEEKDYEALMQSGKMFCRKCATGISDALMDRLDREHGVKPYVRTT